MISLEILSGFTMKIMKKISMHWANRAFAITHQVELPLKPPKKHALYVCALCRICVRCEADAATQLTLREVENSPCRPQQDFIA